MSFSSLYTDLLLILYWFIIDINSRKFARFFIGFCVRVSELYSSSAWRIRK